MKRQLYLLFLPILVCGLSSWAQGQDKSIQIELDTSEWLIGAQYSVQYSFPISEGMEDSEWSWSEIGKKEDLEVVHHRTSSEDGMLKLHLQLAVFDTGYFEIPEIHLFLSSEGQMDTLFSENIPLTIYAPEQYSSDLLPIKTIIEDPEPFNYTPLIIAAGVLILAILLYFFFARRKKRRNREFPIAEKVEIRDPDEYALSQLELLKNKGLIEQEEYNQFYTELSFIFRRWLRDRFNFSALEQTTHEIIAELGQIETQAHRMDDWKNIFQVIDAVKYAQGKPDDNFHRRALHSIEEFIQAEYSKRKEVKKEE